MKGLLFAGDSFTWGQGLYFYSDLPNIKQPPKNGFNSCDVTEAQLKYKDTKRFSRIVADHYGTFELVKDSNGGSDLDSIKFIDDSFIEMGYSYDDFEYVFFQTTHFFRSKFDFELDGKIQKTFVTDHNFLEFTNYQNFSRWLTENNYDIDTYLVKHKTQVFNKIRDKMLEIENKGIKCGLMCWDDDYLDLIRNNKFMKNRLIQFKYKDNEYINFKDLIKANHYLQISGDVKNLGENPPQDGHLGLVGHQIVAENIIKFIEKYKNII
jgi:hypothetical protein